jgi:rod shape determining protein RodA
MIKIAAMARDDFAVYLSVGLVIFLLFQTILNIGMNLGLLPIAGVPLPYLSYGGSSLLVSLFAIGLFESIYLRRKTV